MKHCMKHKHNNVLEITAQAQILSCELTNFQISNTSLEIMDTAYPRLQKRWTILRDYQTVMKTASVMDIEKLKLFCIGMHAVHVASKLLSF